MEKVNTGTKVMTWVLGILMALTVLMGVASFFVGDGTEEEAEISQPSKAQNPF